MSNSSQGITDSPQYQLVAEKIGRFIEYWGFKQVHGRIWTLIFLSPEPVDANFLKNNLKISKALTSMSIKDLIYYKVILEVEKDKPGTQKYQVNPDITEVILDIVRRRELQMLGEIRTACQGLNKSINKNKVEFISLERMNELCEMVETAQFLCQGMTSGATVDFQKFDDVMNINH